MRSSLLSLLKNSVRTAQFSQNGSTFGRIKSIISSQVCCYHSNRYDGSQNLFKSSSLFSVGILKRQVHTIKPKEVSFSIPYGEIAGHEWGNPDAKNKIICIHGWLDNCASFQCMLPHFLAQNNNSQKYHIITYDQSGVGLSCRKPMGTEYNHLSQVVELRRILKALNWSKYSIIGHSMGAQLGFVTSCLYPEEIEGFVSIEVAFPLYKEVNDLDKIRKSIEAQLSYEKKIHDSTSGSDLDVKVYSWEEAIDKIVEKSFTKSLDRKCAEILMTRGAIKQGSGYVFSRDFRAQNIGIEFWPDGDRMVTYLESKFSPHFRIILGQESVYYEVFTGKMFDKFGEIYQKNCKSFQVTSLPGTHHLHLSNPEPVANVVAEFFESLHSNQK